VAFHSDRGRPHALYVSLLSVLATRSARRAVHEIDDLGLPHFWRQVRSFKMRRLVVCMEE